MKYSTRAAMSALEPATSSFAKTSDANPSWSEEALTPEQFFPSAIDSAATWSGERQLLLAVLQDAMGSFFRYRQDLSTRGKRLFRETHDWLWSTDRHWLCSFESICEHLHIDADYIRRGLKQYYDPVAFSSMPPPVQRRRTRRTNSHLTVVRNQITQQDGDRTGSRGQARAEATPINEEKIHNFNQSA